MAAQKLTRGRFAQIIIMLTILVAAFIWRTVEHESSINVLCSHVRGCTFYVNETPFKVRISTDKMAIETEHEGWMISVENEPLEVTKNANSWQLNIASSQTEVALIITSMDKDIIKTIYIKNE